MGSIRPLVTITILVVVGAYLYVKINQGPMQPHAGDNKPWSQSPDGVSQSSATKGASLAADTNAPAWPATAMSAAPPAMTAAAPAAAPASATSSSAPSSTNTAKDGLPAVPPIPELPPLTPTTGVMPPATQPAATLPKDLPANIPTARYGDEANQTPNATPAKDLTANTIPPTTTATISQNPSSSTIPTLSSATSPPVSTTMPNVATAAIPNTSPPPATAASGSSTSADPTNFRPKSATVLARTSSPSHTNPRPLRNDVRGDGTSRIDPRGHNACRAKPSGRARRNLIRRKLAHHSICTPSRRPETSTPAPLKMARR